MHRFYLPPDQCAAASITLKDREAHHGLRVLRLRQGEAVVVLDGAGSEFRCEVAEVSRQELRLAVKERRLIPPLPCPITLVQALPKGKGFDSIIQKATELGVHRIVPLLAERVVTQLDDTKADSKSAHWQLTAIEASKQCGSAWLPVIDAPVTPAAFLARSEEFDLGLIASLLPGSRPPREWLEAFRRQHQRGPASVCVWVGPEGDFTREEIAMAEASGALPISLGRLVLRVETAAVYCLSVLNHELQPASA